MQLRQSVVLSDIHAPFHNKRALSIALRVISDIKPDEVILLGDIADFYSVSQHGKDPDIDIMLLKEAEATKDVLRQIREASPNSKKVFIEGNHEHRLQRALVKQLPAIYGSVGTENLLDLDTNGYIYIGYHPYQQYNVLGTDLIARHEPVSITDGAAKLTLKKTSASVIFGHLHRIEEARIMTLDGRALTAVGVGCLCDTRHKAFSYVKSHHQWQLGFCVVTCIGRNFFIDNIEIKHVTPKSRRLHAICNGKEYRE